MEKNGNKESIRSTKSIYQKLFIPNFALNYESQNSCTIINTSVNAFARNAICGEFHNHADNSN
jgi:hypothetical protein